MEVCTHAKSLQSCPTLCYPMECSLPGSSVLGFSRQEYWSGLPSPPSGDLPKPGIEPMSLTSPALAGGLSPPGKPTIIIATQKSFFFIQKYILSTFFLGIGSIRMNKKKSAVLKVLTQQKDIKLQLLEKLHFHFIGKEKENYCYLQIM